MGNEKAIATAALQKAKKNIKSLLGMTNNSSTSGGKTKTMVSVAPTRNNYKVKTKFSPKMGGSVEINRKTGEATYTPRFKGTY
jgi:hypothetical protein